MAEPSEKTGDAALRQLAPDEEPVVWPEHFDVGIRKDEVNYGVSPGDGWLAEPYAYVTPPGWDPDTEFWDDEFWNAPFGAARPLRVLGGSEQVRSFFREAAGRVPAAHP